MNATRKWLGSILFLATWVAGCQQPAPPPKEEGPQPDPAMIANQVGQMKMVASGRNKELTYKATESGRVYIVDNATGLYVYDSLVAAGETIMFAPASSRATINKQPVDLIRGTNENDEYRMYFLPQ